MGSQYFEDQNISDLLDELQTACSSSDDLEALYEPNSMT